MYCSSCGVAVNSELTYCNYCGAKLNRDGGQKSREVRPEALVMMMVATFVMGTFVITLLMGMMKAVLRFDIGPILAITAFCFLIMLTIESVFIRLLLRSQRDAPETKDTRPHHRGTTRELAEESDKPLEPVASVTEHTTRTFSPVYNERK